ncbi:alpha-L-fucosidase [Pseudactinotalea suaedae]|uniref:alpha-L-fucosidase n=1 Tax=Pseudactinotalea suaedae TaxID=1524924 RepID=UPI001F503D24|nr:alpha-L-fucosidase [Pseudactinotalea suaedae]
MDVSDSSEALAHVAAIVARGPYAADWDSLTAYEAPLWYQDAKFGIFLHWGVFTVPAYGSEWYPRNAYRRGTPEFDHHVATYGPHREFGYKDFIPDLRMESYDPQAWASLFREAGAQFVVPVAEHHDGFAMYHSDRTRWAASKVGPQRDVLGDLAEATRRAGMVAGVSSHRAEHWFFLNGGTRFDSDVLDPAYQDFYGPAQREETAPNEAFLQDWLLRTVEIIDRYRPQVLWFDWWIETPAFEPYLRTLAAYYYNRAAEWGVQVVLQYKWEAFARGSAVRDIERGAMTHIQDDVWQNDTSISRNSWSWHPEQDYKSCAALVAELADCVAKNGALLLNMCPKADGTFDPREVEIVRELGRWLGVYGQAIYGTRPWLVPVEGPTRAVEGSFVDDAPVEYTDADIRFTRRIDKMGEHLYAIVLARPASGTVRIRSWGTHLGLLLDDIETVEVLGDPAPAVWRRTPEALEVDLTDAHADLPGVAIRVLLASRVTPRRHDFIHE